MNDHSITVWKVMQRMALEKTWNQDYANDMFILGYLHDIGKQLWYIADHAERGWEILKRVDYKYRQEVYYHGAVNIQYSSPELDLLNTADLQVTLSWEYVSTQVRLEDIANRHGMDSTAYQNSVNLAQHLWLL